MPRRLTTAEYKIFINESTNGEYELVSNYINGNTKLDILHKKCGNVSVIRPCNFEGTKTKCSKCRKDEELKRNRDIFIKHLSEDTNSEYELVSNYIASRTKVDILHKKCGNTITTTPYNFIRAKNKDSKCPKCSGYRKDILLSKNENNFTDYVSEDTNGEYELISIYIDYHVKMDIIHKKCGTIRSIEPGFFKRNRVKCKLCSRLKNKE